MAGTTSTSTGNASRSNLPAPDVLANIHDRLSFDDRLAFAAVFGASCRRGDLFKPGSPWLVLPGEAKGTAKLFSLADHRAATVRIPGDPEHAVLGSSGGWLVTVSARGRVHAANPVTGERHPLPAITTVPFVHALHQLHLGIDMQTFLRIRFAGDSEEEGAAPRLTTVEMREWLYGKVVMSASPRTGSYAAMLILERWFGAPAFAVAGDAAWRLAPSVDGVEDAVHHDGRFYTVTYSGVVEAWDREVPEDGGSSRFASTEVAARLPADYMLQQGDGTRKYIATAPDGRLMVVLKGSKKIKCSYGGTKRKWWFKVLVLLDDSVDGGGRRWEEDSVGETAVLVGLNSSICVSTREHPELKDGCVYYADDELGSGESAISLRRCDNGGRGLSRFRYYPGDSDDGYNGKRGIGVYRLKDGKAKKLPALGKHRTWPLPVWFTPTA
jgi:hypothetical protein